MATLLFSPPPESTSLLVFPELSLVCLPPSLNICFQQSPDTTPLYVAPCSSQVPGYIANYDGFAAKGVSDIYIVAVNDIVSTLINILSVSFYLGQYN